MSSRRERQSGTRSDQFETSGPREVGGGRRGTYSAPTSRASGRRRAPAIPPRHFVFELPQRRSEDAAIVEVHADTAGRLSISTALARWRASIVGPKGNRPPASAKCRHRAGRRRRSSRIVLNLRQFLDQQGVAEDYRGRLAVRLTGSIFNTVSTWFPLPAAECRSPVCDSQGAQHFSGNN